MKANGKYASFKQAIKNNNQLAANHFLYQYNDLMKQIEKLEKE